MRTGACGLFYGVYMKTKISDMKIKNYYISNFLEKRDMNVKQLAKIIGINHQLFLRYFRFKSELNEANKNKVYKYFLSIDKNVEFKELFPNNFRDIINTFWGKDSSIDLIFKEKNDDLPIEPNQFSVDDNLDKQVLKKDLDTFLSENISNTEKKVLYMYYGIGHDRELSLEEISENFHFTRERSRQIKNKALEKILRYQRSWDNGNYGIISKMLDDYRKRRLMSWKN